MPHADLLDEARDRFKLAVDADARQREQEREDLRFQVPEEQWEDSARKARMGDQFTPPRPTLSITKIDAPVRLTRNLARAAKLGVNVHPISEEADEETAEIIQGLYRRIERDSNATTARMWAFDRALKAGRGFYRVTTAYDEDADETFDQEIRIERILYQDAVYLDPAALQPDWSDGEWAFVTAWVPLPTFKRQYPGAKVSTGDSAIAWEDSQRSAPDWVRGGFGKDSAVLIAEYWYKEHETVTVEIGEHKRQRDEVRVYVAKITGAEIVEEPTLWNGHYIPIIPVLGSELQPYDERRRFAGMITNAKDGQRLYNYAASSMVEGMALEPKAPFIGVEGQFEGHEAQWLQANTRNFPYLEYRPRDLNGTPAPPPQRAQVDGTRMNLAVMALREADGFIQSTTAVHEPSLGRLSKDERSGRAILALQQQADTSNGDYISNLAEVAMAYEARVVLDLMPAIYDRPGRITRIIRGDDQKSESVALNAPFVAEEGRPRVVPQGTKGAKTYDLAAGRYGLDVDIGRSYRTRLQEGDEALTRIVEARPDMMEVFGDIWFQFRDHPGANEISKRLAKIREMKYPGLGEGEGGQMPPEQIQAQAQAMKQENEALKQHLQAAGQAIQTDQAKQQAQLMKAQMDGQAALAKAQMDQQTALAKVQMEIASKEAIAAAQEETKRLIAGLRAEIEGVKALVQTQDSAEERRESMAHEVAMAAAQPPAPTPAGDGA